MELVGLGFGLDVTEVDSLAGDTVIEVRMVSVRESLDTSAEFEGEIVAFANVDEVGGIDDKVLFEIIITVTVEDTPVLETSVRIVVFVIEYDPVEEERTDAVPLELEREVFWLLNEDTMLPDGAVELRFSGEGTVVLNVPEDREEVGNGGVGRDSE